MPTAAAMQLNGSKWLAFGAQIARRGDAIRTR
jgi:hypothetical protein